MEEKGRQKTGSMNVKEFKDLLREAKRQLLEARTKGDYGRADQLKGQIRQLKEWKFGPSKKTS